MASTRFRVVVLLTLTGLSFVALIVLGLRSLNRFEGSIARILGQAAAYSAEQTARQIQGDFKSPVFHLLDQLTPPTIRNLHFARIAEMLRERFEHVGLVDTFFVWSGSPSNPSPEDWPTGSPPIFFYSLYSVGDLGDRPLAAADAGANGFFIDPVLATIVQREALRIAPLRRDFGLAYLSIDGNTHHVVYHFMYEEDGALSAFEGFMADPEHLRQGYFKRSVAEWAIAAAPNSEFPALAVSILDDEGREVATSGRSLLNQFEAEVRFPFQFFDPDLFDALSPYRSDARYWKVRTGYEVGDIRAIVQQESMQQRLAWLLVGLVAVVGISLTARSTAVEIRLSEMKSEFAASVSHDLRTPLAKIQLYAETLESGRAKTPEKVAAYHRVISAQAVKLTHLLSSLLDFSKIEAGIRQYPRDELDLRAVLQSTVEMFDHELAQEGYEVEIAIPDAEVSVVGSSEGLQQMFGNIIGNALKYSPRERFLRVALSMADGHAVVEFTDHGIGIPRREQRRIFQKFYRGSGAVVLAASGSGIGLAIVDHVVRAHGGTVSVESNRGQGTTFRVRLPLMKEADIWAATDSGY